MKNMSFVVQFRGMGFDKKLANKNLDHQARPCQEIITEISGPEPAYVSTAKMVMHCALTILTEQKKIPVRLV